MTNLPLRNEDIEKYKQEEEIIKLTAEQVIKDFGLFGIEISFSGISHFAYDELYDQLESEILELLQTDYRKLVSLLYHIDLSESALKEASLDQSIVKKAEIFAGKILEREFKKVLIRKFYK
jgi:hypothetical protein